MSDGIRRFPPEFDSNKKLPRRYDLEQIDVYVEAPPGDYFNINGLPENIGYGKHGFTIYVTEPDGQAPLKNLSNVLFEAKDSAGNLIYSGNTNASDLNGASVIYLWIKEDPLSTTNNIQPGIGSLTIVGQLKDVPNKYTDVYNLRTSFPLNIRLDYLNTSPILFQSSSKISSDLSISETIEADIDNVNFNKSYANITLKNLQTFGGEVNTIQVSYLESGSLSVLQDEEFTLLTQQDVNKISGSFEDDIDFRIASGLNPISQSFRVVMPPMANQTGSNFGLGDNKFKFKFDFLNKNNEKAKDLHTGQDLNITSSFISFAGPPTVITGEDNLIAGQVYIGESVGQGIEVSAGSAFLRNVDYLGFTSASVGSGSGFMLYSGSVLSANTDEYSQGGVGFEFVSSSEAFMRFNTHPGIFDVRAKSFFVGSRNTQFISGSGDVVEISSSKFHLRADGSVTMSGQLAVEAGGTIGGFTIGDSALSTDAFILSSSQNTSDPVSFISSSNFKVSAGGQLTASSAFIDGAIITGSSTIDVENDIKVKGVKVAALNVNNNIVIGDSNAELTASTATIDTLHYTNLSGSFISASGARLNGDMTVDGTITANNFVTNTIQENFSAGTTTFGNTNDDFHRFTGSVEIHHTGSTNVGLFLTGSQLRVDNDISASGDFHLKSGNSIYFGDELAANQPYGKIRGSTEVLDLTHPQGNYEAGIRLNTQGNIFFANVHNGALDFNSDTKMILSMSIADGKAQLGLGTIYPTADFEVRGTNGALAKFSGSGDYQIEFDYAGQEKFDLSHGTSGLYFRKSDTTLAGFTQDHDFGVFDTSGNRYANFDGTSRTFGLGGNPNSVQVGMFHISGSGNNANYSAVFQTTSSINYLKFGNSTTDIGAGEGFDVGINGTAAYLLNRENAAMIFATNNTEQMRLQGSGKLGLGTTQPIAPGFTILNNATIASVTDRFAAASSSLLTLTGSGGGIQTQLSMDGNEIVQFGHNLYISAQGNNDLYGNIRFRTGNTSYTDRLFISSSGNIGIGTTSPSSTLHIDGGDQTAIISDRNGNGTNIVLKRSGTQRLTLSTTNNAGAEAEIFSNGDLLFNNSAGGNVGIGKSSPSEKLDVSGNIKTDGNISSPTFESGFAGSGFRITSGSDGKQSFTIDELNVRGSMSVYELLIHQIRATNGSLFVSSTGKITSASLHSTNTYSMSLDNGGGYGHSFQVGDLIRSQRFVPSTNGSGSSVFKSDLHVISVEGTGSFVGVLTGSDVPQIGYEYVRIGSTTDTDRQGSIYLTSDDDNAPFIDVADSVDAHSDFNTTGTIKTRLGKLTGVTSNKFGTLSGYGFYASGSAFLEGTINASAGEIGGWVLGTSVISSSKITLDTENELIALKSTTFKNAGVQLSGSGEFYAGDGSNEFIKFEDGKAAIKASNFELDSSGNITATSADLSGKLTSTEGHIGGFGIGDSKISSSLFTLSSSVASDEIFISHSGFKVFNSGEVTASALLLTGSGANYLRYYDGSLIIRGDVAATSISTPSASIDAQGFLTATSGSIGGFTLESDKIKSINSSDGIILDADSNAGILKVGKNVGSITFDSDTNRGFYVDGNGNFRVGKKDGSRIFFSSVDNSLQISSSNVELSGSDINITTQNLTASGSNVSIQTPKFFMGGTSQFISGSDGNIEISSSQFHLDSDGTATFGGNINVGSQVSQTNLNDGLVIHYNFDQYFPGPGHIGLTQPGTRFPLINSAVGFSNQSASFTSNDQIFITTGSGAIANTALFFSGSDRTSELKNTQVENGIQQTANWSLSFFFKPTNKDTTGRPIQQIFGAGGGSNGFNAFITQSKVITNFYENDKGSVTSASIENDTWYHLASTYNNGEAKLYINSELIQTDNISVGSLSGFSGDIRIAGANNYSQEYYLESGSSPIDGGTLGMTSYEGYIDEIRVYRNKILTQNEVTALYLNPQAQTSTIVHGGQITAGIIKSLNSGENEGTILNLQEGQIHAGGSGSYARFLFDGEQLRVSASSFFVGSEAFISSSGANIEISASNLHLQRDGNLKLSGSITANDGTIGGFNITNEGLSINNIKLSSDAKGLVISSSEGIGKVLISSGSLSSTAGSLTNYFVNPSFEELTADTIISASSPTTLGGWCFANDSATGDVEELWNSGSVSMSIADSDASDGSKHITINIHKELGPGGTGEDQIPT